MIDTPLILQAVFLCFLCTLNACGGSQSPGQPVVVESPVVVAPVGPIKPTVPPEVRILVIGQSIASNCNEKVYGPSPNVFQVGLAGEIKPASDPFDWADCKQGSMWMPLGKMMIDAGMASKVTFMPIGISATAVADWQEGGRAYPKLNAAIDVITKHGIQFDYAFWHQGSSDIGTKRVVYASRLKSVVAYITKSVKIERLLVALHSRCNGNWDREIEAAQLDVIASSPKNIFLGANNNSLDDAYRIDRCHLNASGQEEMARLWFDSIKNAK